jgi:tRNA uridine 5-carboxymethylaminomethyl modification enzyme
MKTGTPVRIDGRSVHFEELTEQPGEKGFHKFSYLDFVPHQLKQLSCWTLFTNEDCHEILRKGLPDSPLYNGQIQSIGPRYCPSIETKIVTFADKTRHQLFLEPEGEHTQEYYLNGFSSSLPLEIQLQALQAIPAFRDIQIYRPGYAIEYDFFDPTQLKHNLETKQIKNLFFAGQINGTTGYEEAGGQGLMAGVNAHINCHGGEPFVLGRDEAYIGVLIDDLVTKGIDEPYRMFTSRAEYRILLRQDDADVRLTEKSHKLGLAKQERYGLLQEKKTCRDSIISFVENYSVKPQQVNDRLESLGTASLAHGCKLIDLVLRPQLTLETLASLIPALQTVLDKVPASRKEEIIEATEILIKYNGYIKREKIIAEKINRLENIRIKGKFDYHNIQSLSTEARQKLTKIDPDTIAQANRIPGISPSDINILLVLLGR